MIDRSLFSAYSDSFLWIAALYQQETALPTSLSDYSHNYASPTRHRIENNAADERLVKYQLESAVE